MEEMDQYFKIGHNICYVCSTLKMTDEQTLVLYSGHPMGLYPSHKDAPRVVITNGMMIPNYSKPDDWEKFNTRS